MGHNWKALGSATTEGDSPVQVKDAWWVWYLSRRGSETPPLNQPAPSGKAKYKQKTDSEEYREGKVKRTGRTRVKSF